MLLRQCLWSQLDFVIPLQVTKKLFTVYWWPSTCWFLKLVSASYSVGKDPRSWKFTMSRIGHLLGILLFLR